MPIYEYECSQCHERFQRLVRLTVAEIGDCAACGSSAVRRLVSPPALLRGVDPGIGRASYPTSWEQTGGGDGEIVLNWQRRVERERKQEAADPELVALRAAAAENRWSQLQKGGSLRRNVPDHGHAHHHAAEHPQDSRTSLGDHRPSMTVSPGETS